MTNRAAQWIAILVVGLTVGVVAQQVQPPVERLTTPLEVVVDVGPRTTALYHRESCPWLKSTANTTRFKLADAKARVLSAALRLYSWRRRGAAVRQCAAGRCN